MSLIEFAADKPLVPLVAVLSVGVIIYCAWLFYSSRKTGPAGLLSLCVLAMFFMFFESYKGALREGSTRTVVVMPDKQNLRLGEDGKLAFCIDGIARNWEKTHNGIVSTSIRTYMGEPMRCLTIEQSVQYLRANGASDEQIATFRRAYEIQ
ncbi:hypothetical protein [Gilvimarinus chinensis]|uniref:hypothetical protein n=1 Tax=Gilvimarinus chinensis TaxID=396005 RepID=UPI000372BB44|nr:hypothetical protein [Gilvimarinus chinensis]